MEWYMNKKLWVALFALAATVAVVVYKNEELAAAINALGEIVVTAVGG